MIARVGAYMQNARLRVFIIFSAIYLIGLWMHSSPRPNIQHLGPLQEYSRHPVARLVEANRAHLEKIQSKQSRTLNDARNEYTRRYCREPPLGFDAWFRTARKHEFVLIDEFDTFMESLEPYFGISADVLRHRMEAAFQTGSSQLGVVNFEDRSVYMSDGVTELFDHLMPKEEWIEYIPYNVTLLVNQWDEPMVSVPFAEVQRAKEAAKTGRKSSPSGSPEVFHSPFDFNFIETGKQNGWAVTSQACSIESPSRQFSCPQISLKDPLSFVADIKTSRDVCENCHLQTEHGLLLSPETMHITHNFTPIWSASKPSHFNDILYPSAYYIGVRKDYLPELDRSWDEKDSRFYWAGRSTGGHATEETWSYMQRQRMVMKTNNHSEPVQLLNETSEGEWQPYFTIMDEVADLFLTHISGITQCSGGGCQMEEAAFGHTKGSLDPKEAAYRHKFVMDIDGNGFSGRFYRLLQSRSVVVKQTILSEWHDDRLIPWVHYVPLSTNYAELPELARYLASTEEGLRISEQIASESTDWHNRALRDIDLQLVWLRMILEFGRLMNPDVHEE